MLIAMLPKVWVSPPACSLNTSASTGIITNASTQARSSTISQPIAILPRLVSSRRRSSMARNRTTVLAVASEKPNTMPCTVGQSIAQASAQPSTVATAICTIAPGMAIALTSIRSFNEKCRPTPNISNMIPISASCVASSWSATKPGLKGPTQTPATR